MELNSLQVYRVYLDITTGILILKLNLLFLKMAGTHRTTVHKQKVWRLTQKMKILDL
jgi:hypothetical protein